MTARIDNVFQEARLRFEQRQKELHGCNYVDGVCTAHNGEPPKPKKAKKAKEDK
jgi:hypothetical protein